MTSITTTDFRSFIRNRHVDAQDSGPARLSPSFLLTNEMGVSSEHVETITSEEWSRVVFHLPSAKVKSAELLFYVKGANSTQDQPLRLLVNGHRITHRQQVERMLTGGWDRLRIAARFLKEGRNEIIFAENGVLYVDPGPVGNSSRSFDSGRNWHTNALGNDTNMTGEYLVRLRLKGYAPQGQLTSPVVDMADPENQGVIAPELKIRPLRLNHKSKTPEGTRVRFELRSGSTPTFDPHCWTPWEMRTTLRQSSRFVQWRAHLSTNTAGKTPVLESVTLEAGIVSNKRNLENIQHVEIDQPQIVYSSYPFEHMAPHPRLTRLRQQYKLDEVVADGDTELEKFALLRDWVHSQWLGWQAQKYPHCPTWDPLDILETTKGNWGFGMCTHYGATFVGCAVALGYTARVLVVNHHCLAEIWSEDLQKWILQDPGPAREYDATYEHQGVPVNALEFHRFHRKGKAHLLKINKLPGKDTARMTNHWGNLFCRFGIPLRNNHLVEAKPAELHHGYSQYHWDGYLWWSVDIDPQFSEYSLQTTRPEDFYWSVNQTRIYPQATDLEGLLAVGVETTTPNFSHLLVKVNGGPWTEHQGPIEWTLQSGGNEIQVRSANIFGQKGRIARAKLHYNP